MISLKDFIENQQINEARLYEGGEELARYISKLIKEHPQENFFIINGKDLKFKNILFKYMFIYINEHLVEELIDAKYHDEKYSDKVDKSIGNLLRWNESEKIFNYVELSITTSDKNDRNVDWTDLSHELNHIKQSYDRKIKNPSDNLFTNVDLNEYNISRNLYSNSRNRFEIIVSYIKYVNTEFERESFSVQASEKFKENLSKLNNISNALEQQIKDNKTFAQYFIIYNWFIDCKKSKSMSKSLCNTYRKNYKDAQNLSDNEIIESLDNYFAEYYKALTEDINTIVAEYGKKNAL